MRQVTLIEAVMMATTIELAVICSTYRDYCRISSFSVSRQEIQITNNSSGMSPLEVI
jgi:hypothetical protein